jgi:hypothetical protein
MPHPDGQPPVLDVAICVHFREGTGHRGRRLRVHSQHPRGIVTTGDRPTFTLGLRPLQQQQCFCVEGFDP